MRNRKKKTAASYYRMHFIVEVGYSEKSSERNVNKEEGEVWTNHKEWHFEEKQQNSPCQKHTLYNADANYLSVCCKHTDVHTQGGDRVSEVFCARCYYSNS